MGCFKGSKSLSFLVSTMDLSQHYMDRYAVVFVCVLRILTLNYGKDWFSRFDGDLTMSASNIGRNP